MYRQPNHCVKLQNENMQKARKASTRSHPARVCEKARAFAGGGGGGGWGVCVELMRGGLLCPFALVSLTQPPLPGT